MSDTLATLTAALEGRYRIEREVGEGGMATVFLAHDLRHDRKVALKVLKPQVAEAIGASRFLAEIKTTAKLQHPHILPLFDSGEAGSHVFYVMPFVEGETVGERIKRERQLPVDEAVEIARNVAEALDFAHRNGVIHRDIKPSNILLQDGKPVLADFGIALAIGVASGNRLTETGLVLGTPLYMSPEQATGDAAVGAATDIYSLGCVLYEMLVGSPPHTGSTTQAILARIVTADPISATELRRSVPLHIDRAITRALEKLPADRFKHASDFAKALTAAEPAAQHAIVGHAVPGVWKRVAVGLAIVALVLVIVSAWSLSELARPASPPIARFNVTPAEAQRRVRTANGVDFALSPDGLSMVYVGVAPGGKRQLWLRRLADLSAQPIPGTDGASSPDISPDGRSIVFQATRAIQTIPLEGGTPTAVVPSGEDPIWAPDGTIYFIDGGRVFRAGRAGPPVAVTTPTTNTIHAQPDVLPNGRGILVSVVIGPTVQTRIGVVSASGGAPRDLVEGTMARYSSTGHLVYAKANGTLMAAPFDLRRLEVSGPPVAAASGLAVDRGSAGQFALSESGTLVYGTGAGTVSELVWVSRDGQVDVIDSTWTGDLGSPALSPDGRQLAVAMQGESSMDIWVKQLDRGPSLRLTVDGTRNDYPTWSPDGRFVTFTTNRVTPSFDLFSRRADGTGEVVLEHDEARAVAEARWSPDGTWLVFRTSTNEPGNGDILARRRARDVPVPLATTEFTEFAPALSPDGQWMAYASTETGRAEIVVVPFPNPGGGRHVISTGGGTEPAWSRDGSELFFRDGSGHLVATSISTEPVFTVSPSRTLFSAAPYRSSSVRRQYEVSLDGKRFIMIRPVGGVVEGQLVLVQGFDTELRQRITR